MPTVTIPNRPVGSDVRSIAAILANFDAITSVINGGLDGTNISDSSIGVSKTGTGSSGLAEGSFSAYRNAALTISRGGVILFDVEEWDISSWYNPATGRYTPQRAGYYRVSAQTMLNQALPDGDYIYAQLLKNGTEHRRGQTSMQGGSFTSIGSSVNALVLMNGSTDFLQVQWNSNTATPYAMSVGGPAFTFFQAEFVGRS